MKKHTYIHTGKKIFFNIPTSKSQGLFLSDSCDINCSLRCAGAWSKIINVSERFGPNMSI